ncbi:hypothetical protein [Tolumonas lignilytica]|uniref:hypothetical protein n=1 Tax=Tolumonas lignilytica TaxID=1283284 RepID=UPI000465015C|nr:hypothetical protein [Tolumonas lignilytica]
METSLDCLDYIRDLSENISFSIQRIIELEKKCNEFIDFRESHIDLLCKILGEISPILRGDYFDENQKLLIEKLPELKSELEGKVASARENKVKLIDEQANLEAKVATLKFIIREKNDDIRFRENEAGNKKN